MSSSRPCSTSSPASPRRRHAASSTRTAAPSRRPSAPSRRPGRGRDDGRRRRGRRRIRAALPNRRGRRPRTRPIGGGSADRARGHRRGGVGRLRRAARSGPTRHPRLVHAGPPGARGPRRGRGVGPGTWAPSRCGYAATRSRRWWERSGRSGPVVSSPRGRGRSPSRRTSTRSGVGWTAGDTSSATAARRPGSGCRRSRRLC